MDGISGDRKQSCCRRCCVFNCRKTTKDGVRLNSLPFPGKHLPNLVLVRRIRWINALKPYSYADFTARYVFVCGKHFISGKPSALTDETNPDWVPHLNLAETNATRNYGEEKSPASALFFDDQSVVFNGAARGDSERSQDSEDISMQDDLSDDSDYDQDTFEINCGSPKKSDTDAPVQSLNSKPLEIRQGRGLSDVLESDDVCNFYTGISCASTLLILFNYLKNTLPVSACGNFPKDRVFIMTLSKMRLGTSFTELGYNYNVSRPTVTKFFYETLYAISDGLRFALKPPDKISLAIHTPPQFKNYFGDRRVFIFDCFEVRCNSPGRPKAGVCHFSGYKRTHTVKFLIVGHPDGTIGFVSKAYGGRCSDLYITKDCGILDLIEPGDIVLADKGFDIQDLIEAKGATLNIPVFLRKKLQFSPQELDQNKQITSLRVHIERLIRLVRSKYQELGIFISIDTFTRFQNGCNTLDLIVRVACILANFNKSIIT